MTRNRLVPALIILFGLVLVVLLVATGVAYPV